MIQESTKLHKKCYPITIGIICGTYTVQVAIDLSAHKFIKYIHPITKYKENVVHVGTFIDACLQHMKRVKTFKENR